MQKLWGILCTRRGGHQGRKSEQKTQKKIIVKNALQRFYTCIHPTRQSVEHNQPPYTSQNKFRPTLGWVFSNKSKIRKRQPYKFGYEDTVFKWLSKKLKIFVLWRIIKLPQKLQIFVYNFCLWLCTSNHKRFVPYAVLYMNHYGFTNIHLYFLLHFREICWPCPAFGYKHTQHIHDHSCLKWGFDPWPPGRWRQYQP